MVIASAITLGTWCGSVAHNNGVPWGRRMGVRPGCLAIQLFAAGQLRGSGFLFLVTHRFLEGGATSPLQANDQDQGAKRQYHDGNEPDDFGNRSARIPGGGWLALGTGGVRGGAGHSRRAGEPFLDGKPNHEQCNEADCGSDVPATHRQSPKNKEAKTLIDRASAR
jgi:hypothetical protein